MSKQAREFWIVAGILRYEDPGHECIHVREVLPIGADVEKAIDAYAESFCVSFPVGDDELAVNEAIKTAMRDHVLFGLSLRTPEPSEAEKLEAQNAELTLLLEEANLRLNTAVHMHAKPSKRSVRLGSKYEL